ncbi:PepSY domain-containing protein [uncultured Erythrobacter sp.]|uniref:PepSY domain-containing protein n=1 Tax=uncultured Erythrobacter sp. TaxID=263913 RepID=UPI00262FE20B|nr:PepSY domain-containing protein [uncultured Erythrobacter sp.]
MTRNRSFLAACAAAVTLTALGVGSASAVVASEVMAQEQSRSDQGDARREMRAGNQLSLREIERRVLPRMRGSEYLGPSYDSTARAYRLKFIRDGRVTYVDVDARTGRIINRSN